MNINASIDATCDIEVNIRYFNILIFCLERSVDEKDCSIPISGSISVNIVNKDALFGLEISCAKVKQTAAGGCLAIPVDGHISQISLAINSDNKQIASEVAGTCLDCCRVTISVDEVPCDIKFSRYIP